LGSSDDPLDGHQRGNAGRVEDEIGCTDEKPP